VLARKKRKVAANLEAVTAIIGDYLAMHGIAGNWQHARRLFSGTQRVEPKGNAQSIKPELLDAVDAALPPQPWPRRVHIQVAEQLMLSNAFVQRAIRELIRQGRREDQFEGQILPRMPVGPAP
jgi:hypothetical protein